MAFIVCLFRPYPAFDDGLAGAGEGEFVVFDIAGNRAACACGYFVAQCYRGNQYAVRTDAHFVADDGFVFVHAVVVGNNRARAEVVLLPTSASPM